MSRVLKRLTRKQFDKAVLKVKEDNPRTADKSFLMAEKVLVDGLSLAEAGRLFQVTRERTRAATNLVYAAFEQKSVALKEAAITAFSMLEKAKEIEKLPDDWEPVAVVLPKDLARSVRKMARSELQKNEAIKKGFFED